MTSRFTDSDSLEMKNRFHFHLCFFPWQRQPLRWHPGGSWPESNHVDAAAFKWQECNEVTITRTSSWFFRIDGFLFPTFVSQKTLLYHRNGNGPEPSEAWRERLESHKDVFWREKLHAWKQRQSTESLIRTNESFKQWSIWLFNGVVLYLCFRHRRPLIIISFVYLTT